MTCPFNHTLRFACAIIAGLLLVSFFTPCPSFAETVEDRRAKKKEITQGIKKYRINIRRLQQGIKKQKEQVQQTRQQERDLLAELQDIDTRLLEQKEKLQVLETRMNAQQELIVVKRRELERSRQEKLAVQQHLQKRIQAYYKMGNIGFINVTFSTKTLPELLRFHDSFHDLIKYDQTVIATYRHTIDELERSIESLELEEALLQEFISQNSIEQEKLDMIKQEKEVLLARIRTQTKLHEQAIAEMEMATDSLSSSLKVLTRKEELIDKSFLNNKGKMPPPVQGKIITKFQEKATNRLGISRVSKGIAIEAPAGTPVKAVHEGEVMFSGYLRGYGNSVIVNHGYEYYSISSRVERLLVKKGDKVDERTDIAIMGDTATLMSAGLYFEIRHGSTYLNPLEWLDPELVTLN